jgi:hypothetical protein
MVIFAMKEIQHNTGCLIFLGVASGPQQSHCCAQLLAEWTAGSQGALPDTQPHWYDCRLFCIDSQTIHMKLATQKRKAYLKESLSSIIQLILIKYSLGL